jgi:hypothetical protein
MFFGCHLFVDIQDVISYYILIFWESKEGMSQYFTIKEQEEERTGEERELGIGRGGDESGRIIKLVFLFFYF